VSHPMRDVVEDFERTVEEGARRLLLLGEEGSGRRPEGGGWTAKETVGHLIDSAANNHQRFVRAQYRADLVCEGYEQDEWVAAQHYTEAPWARLVELWRLYNLHLAHVVGRAPEGELRRPRHPHSLDRIAFRPLEARAPATLEYLIRDYVEHLKHHLSQLIPEESHDAGR
jgi:DinB superfamily